MIETILSIKICLAIIFLIGLITGYQFIKSLIREDYSSILKKFTQGIKDNEIEIKDKSLKIEDLNKNISQMRFDIKKQKDNLEIVKSSLRDTEHVYFKLSDTNDKINSEIEDNTKILKSYKKEIEYYKTLLNENLENNISSKNIKLKDDINSMNLSINQNLVKIYSLKEEELSKKENLKDLSIKLQDKNNKLLDLRNKISEKTIELINKNKIFGLELEMDDMQEKLKSYKEELLSLKSK